MFERIKADYYVLIDGDSTYPVDYDHRLLEPVLSQDADMAVGARLLHCTNGSCRPLNVLGNNLVSRLINWVGRSRLTDIMSGYRVFNRQVVRLIAIISSGCEIETEITLQMLYYRRKIVEVTIPYRQRPEGSESKLRTFYDGFRVLRTIFYLFRAFKPLTFFGGLGVLFFCLGILAGILPFMTTLWNQIITYGMVSWQFSQQD